MEPIKWVIRRIDDPAVYYIDHVIRELCKWIWQVSVSQRIAILALFLLLYAGGCSLLYYFGKQDAAKFLISILTAASLLVAICVALFGDWLRGISIPTKFVIRPPERENEMLDHPNGKNVFCHHLVVHELVGDRIVKDCRVWLTAVKAPDGAPLGAFAVPRLMTWAPCEFSGAVRSFRGQQVFDLGVFNVETFTFEVTFHADQGGHFPQSLRRFADQGRRWYVFRIEVEGHMLPQEHIIEVEIVSCPIDSALWLKGKRAVTRSVAPQDRSIT